MDRFSYIIKMHWLLWKSEKEYAKLKRAFIHANNIFAKEDETSKSNKKKKPLTPQERAELWEVLQMAQGINPTEIYKMIES